MYDEIADFYYCDHCDQLVQLLPDSYAGVITGPPGAGKTPDLHYFADFYLRNSRPVILLELDDFPSNLRAPLGAYTSNKLAEYEEAGLLTIVDCYSSIAGLPSKEKFALKNRADLNEISLLTTDLLNERAKLGKPKIFLDSATPLFTYKDPELVVQFLASTAAKVKAKGGAFLISITSGTVSDEIQKRIETLMDLSVELRMFEVDGRKKRQMRIAKARGQRIFEEWIPMYIGNKTISVDVSEDPARYERLKKALRGVSS
jgi:KaiC/GvpD/RAD55 family RecA-like ATPase